MYVCMCRFIYMYIYIYSYAGIYVYIYGYFNRISNQQQISCGESVVDVKVVVGGFLYALGFSEIIPCTIHTYTSYLCTYNLYTCIYAHVYIYSSMCIGEKTFFLCTQERRANELINLAMNTWGGTWKEVAATAFPLKTTSRNIRIRSKWERGGGVYLLTSAQIGLSLTSLPHVSVHQHPCSPVLY